MSNEDPPYPLNPSSTPNRYAQLLGNIRSIHSGTLDMHQNNRDWRRTRPKKRQEGEVALSAFSFASFPQQQYVLEKVNSVRIA
jgi:hypothetical protein